MIAGITAVLVQAHVRGRGDRGDTDAAGMQLVERLPSWHQVEERRAF